MYGKIDNKGFIEFLTKWNTKFDETKNQKSVERLWQDFKMTLTDGASKFIPTKNLSKQDRLPWVNKKIKKLIAKRDKAFAFCKQSKTAVNFDKFRELKKNVQREIRKNYNQYLEEIIDPELDKGK